MHNWTIICLLVKWVCLLKGLPAKVWTMWLESLWARVQTSSAAPSSTSSIASTGSQTPTKLTLNISLSTVSSMGRRSSTSADTTWWQPSWGTCRRHPKRSFWYFFYAGRRSSTSCWRSTTCCRLLAGPSPGWSRRRRTADDPNKCQTTNSVISLISRLRYLVPIIYMLPDTNKCFPVQWRMNQNLVYKML